MNTKSPPKVLLHACPRCRGDLFLDDEGDFACLQCGRHVPSAQLSTQAPAKAPAFAA